MHRNMLSDKALFRDYESLDYGIYEPEKAFATALMLNDWMEEIKENKIVEKYSTTPGALYTKLTNADWLLYSSIELAKLMHVSTHDLMNINVRLKYGIREELLELVRLEQIGRARARLLFINDIRTVNDIRNSREKVVKLLGKEIAEKVLKQLD
jgi:helicase